MSKDCEYTLAGLADENARLKSYAQLLEAANEASRVIKLRIAFDLGAMADWTLPENHAEAFYANLEDK